MPIDVTYTAQLKLALGVRSEQVDMNPPCSLDALVEALIERHGEPLRRWIHGDGEPRHTPVLICVGDRQVRLGEQTTIVAGESVTLMAPISGG